MSLVNREMLHISKNGIEILKFKALEEQGVYNAFSLKSLNFKNRIGIEDEYRKFLDAIGLEYNSLVKPKQAHTDNILILDDKKNLDDADIGLEYLENVDAIITSKEGVTLATTCADCLCVVLYDNEKRVIANIHSGWRGTFKKIVQKTAIKMQENYGCEPNDIKVYMAPSIRKCHFEVDVDVMEECKRIFGYMNNIDDFISIGRNIGGIQKYNIDTVLINKTLLNEIGIPNKNIIDSGICSVCNSDKMHSRRAEGEEYGLGTLVVMMKTM